jgi:hypothetical protein
VAARVNHIPDAVLDAIDDLGRSLLTDEPTVVDERLRSDLQVRIDCDRAALTEGVATVTFRLQHGSPARTLRGHGSFVETIVDGVDSRLRAWGVDPPASYTHRDTDGEWQVYVGRVRLP